MTIERCQKNICNVTFQRKCERTFHRACLGLITRASGRETGGSNLNDKLTKNIERTAAIIDLVAAIIFVAMLLKVYGWLDEMLVMIGG
ncbi:hypothetical protein SAMN05660706_13516 [Desulfoscipio geothermicus DSM 3669]|uniref:Uncharacterized protein n=1 Tax=Desulfoscipio geothermicus DSM 3669 TaxID=1121426 RepID=A0A1I6EC28_9FIRM|nr:hypothetical protein SAMN05660706_13516 [Desulfoscipio geothermicus DSM 3669]